MNTSFFKTTGKLLILTLIVGGSFMLNAQEKFGGLALYTVRDDMSKDVKATLQAVANAGYKNIEAAGYKDGKYYDMSPQDFKKLLKELKLKSISTHQAAINLDNADQMFADAKAAGFEYFVVPIPPMGMYSAFKKSEQTGTSDLTKKMIKILDNLGERCHKAGLKLLYHNHAIEFTKDKDGFVPIEYLLENCNPKHVNFQMDLYWVTKAGADPVDYFKKYPGRFIIWHVKDMDDEGRFAPVGNGNIDFARILANKKLSGMKYYMVEQDRTFNMTPLEAIKVSHKGIEEIGFK